MDASLWFGWAITSGDTRSGAVQKAARSMKCVEAELKIAQARSSKTLGESRTSRGVLCHFWAEANFESSATGCSARSCSVALECSLRRASNTRVAYRTAKILSSGLSLVLSSLSLLSPSLSLFAIQREIENPELLLQNETIVI